jgi:hypothetical protein
VIRNELSIDFPDSVLNVLAELQQERFVESIWFMGSQANHCATSKSDWDFLVFISIEPEVVPKRHPEVDIVRIGPSGRVLAEGAGAALEISFQDFEWSLKDEMTASYVGRKYVGYEKGIRDCSEPFCLREKQSAYLIWSRDASDPSVVQTDG